MRGRRAAAVVAGLVALAIAGSFALGSGEGNLDRSSDPRREPPPATPSRPPAPTLVPDRGRIGAHLYVVGADGSGVRRVTRGRGVPVAPVWSPSGRAIAFRWNGGIDVVTHEGRRIRRIAGGLPPRAPNLGTPTWSPDSTRLAYVVSDSHTEFARRTRGKLGGANLVVARLDGRATRTVSRRARAASAGGPAWSPDGRLIAFESIYDAGPIPGRGPPTRMRITQPELSVVRPDGSGERRVTRDPPRHRQPRGTDDETEPQWLNSRELVYVSLVTGQGPGPPRFLRVVDARDGGVRTVLDDLRYAILAASPDGTRVAMAGVLEGHLLRLYSARIDGGKPTRLDTRNVTTRPTWSPDGRRIAYAYGDRIEVVRADGGGRRTLVRRPNHDIREVAWSPDGRRIAFTSIPTPPVPAPYED